MVFFLLNCADNFLFLNCSNYFQDLVFNNSKNCCYSIQNVCLCGKVQYMAVCLQGKFLADSLYFLVIPWSPGGGKDTGNLPQPDAVGSYKELKLSLEIFE